MEEKEVKKENIHDGHRGRLLDTITKCGIENVSEVQAMEFFLFYIFPRGDVNPLAHRLLNEFGNVAKVIDADINELKQIPGMGDRSAKSLKLLGEFFFYYTQNKLGKKIRLSNYGEIVDYFDELLRFEPMEIFCIIALDKKFNLLQSKKLARGSVKNVSVFPITIANFISSNNPSYIVFAHNHPGGSAIPSKEDDLETERLKNILDCMGVGFLDHIIIGQDGVYSYKNEKILSEYH